LRQKGGRRVEGETEAMLRRKGGNLLRLVVDVEKQRERRIAKLKKKRKEKKKR